MTNKMTYAVALSNAIDAMSGFERSEYDRDNTIATLEKLLASVNKRNARKSTSDKPTKKQVENMGVKAQIVDALRNANEPQPCKAIAEVLGLSVQKVNALLKQMKDAGEVVRTEGKKKVALFALADAGADEGEDFADEDEDEAED